MTAVRRALALLSLGALATVVTAAPAGAAVLNTDACVRYVGGKDQPPMAIGGGGFTPNGVVTLATRTTTKPRPAMLTSSPVQPTGLFLKTTRPPQFSSRTRNLEAFTLIGVDRTNPQAPITATTSFRMVRFGLTSKRRAQAPDLADHVHGARVHDGPACLHPLPLRRPDAAHGVAGRRQGPVRNGRQADARAADAGALRAVDVVHEPVEHVVARAALLEGHVHDLPPAQNASGLIPPRGTSDESPGIRARTPRRSASPSSGGESLATQPEGDPFPTTSAAKQS